MNWLYLIPVVALAVLAITTPLQVAGAVALVVGLCLGAVWLRDKINR